VAQIARILAATDFSPAADNATRRAASLASTLRAVLHVVHVLPPTEMLAQFFPGSPDQEIAALRERADAALQQRLQRIATQFSVTPSWALFHGHAHDAILDAMNLVAPDLVVLGARGEHERMQSSETVGETALKIAERSPVAVLLVRRDIQEHYRHVLACAKAGSGDQSVIEWADRLSPTDLIHILSAYTVPYEDRLIAWGASQATIDVYAMRERDEHTKALSELMNEIGVPLARARLHVERGEPLPTIVGHSREWRADLIVVGRRAQAHSLTAGRFGSVARHIALQAHMDVLIVPPGTSSAESST
jgi:nucleotide-binding universal stress UspA family protein